MNFIIGLISIFWLNAFGLHPNSGNTSLWDELGDHPLDLELKACVDENQGTSSTTICLIESYEKWEIALNEVYQKLRKGTLLDQASKDVLKNAEIEWIKFKDLEFGFIELKYKGIEGTMYNQIIAAEKLRVIRHRTIELEGYFNTLSADRD